MNKKTPPSQVVTDAPLIKRIEDLEFKVMKLKDNRDNSPQLYVITQQNTRMINLLENIWSELVTIRRLQ